MISEEKVREILKGAADLLELKVTDNSVEFLDDSKPPIRYFVTSTEISYEPHNEPKCRNTFTIREYQDTYGEIPEINTVLPKIAALLSPQTETERLEERVRELEKKYDETLSAFDTRGESIKTLQTRNQELEAQLQDHVSKADHEREVETLLSKNSEQAGYICELENRIELYQWGQEEAMRSIRREREMREEMPF